MTADLLEARRTEAAFSGSSDISLNSGRTSILAQNLMN
jgi:hypothetical protein